MNRMVGIALALAALVAGGLLFGWKGTVMALTAVVFWLLLQFTQLMRVMRTANEAPLGHVSSAIMMQAKLHAGMTLVDLIKLTRSLGVKVAPDTYRWTDAGGDAVEVVLEKGKVARWALQRGDAANDASVGAEAQPATNPPSPSGEAATDPAHPPAAPALPSKGDVA